MADKENNDVTKRLDEREFQLEMMKVQICADYVHATFTTFSSFFLVLLAGGIVLALTIRYSTIPFADIVSISLFVIFLVMSISGLILVVQNYDKGFKEISKMMESVKKGKELPPLNEIELLKSNLTKLRK
ncbi:MAG: hypothetical protein ABSG33_08605 [Candidatus Bathyarchaeia archaeon]|jgi:hypothetical protein